jgi:hypothetical protein
MGWLNWEGYSTSMDRIPQPCSVITGANLRPADEDLANLMAEVLANEARHQGKPAPSPEQSQELLGLMLARPEEAPDDTKAPPRARSGERGRGRARRSRRRSVVPFVLFVLWNDASPQQLGLGGIAESDGLLHEFHADL